MRPYKNIKREFGFIPNFLLTHKEAVQKGIEQYFLQLFPLVSGRQIAENQGSLQGSGQNLIFSKSTETTF